MAGIDKRGPIWALIESYQPYTHTELPPWLPADMPNRERWAPRFSHLAILTALDNVDKHRTIHGFSVFPDKRKPINQSLSWNPEAVLIEQKNRESWEPLEDGAELARFRFRPGVEPNVRVTGPIFLEAGFEAEFSETEGFTILLGRMQTIGEGIEEIIESFWDFFPEQPSMG